MELERAQTSIVYQLSFGVDGPLEDAGRVTSLNYSPHPDGAVMGRHVDGTVTLYGATFRPGFHEAIGTARHERMHEIWGADPTGHQTIANEVFLAMNRAGFVGEFRTFYRTYRGSSVNPVFPSTIHAAQRR